MCEHATVKSSDLLLGLLTRKLLRIVSQLAHDFRIVDVTLPKFLRKSVVPAKLLGQLAQLGQANAKTLELSRLFFPMCNTTFISILFQKCEHLGLCHSHGIPSSARTNHFIRDWVGSRADPVTQFTAARR